MKWGKDKRKEEGRKGETGLFRYYEGDETQGFGGRGRGGEWS